MRVKNLYKLQVETGATMSNKAGRAQSRGVVVEWEHDKALKMEPQPISQFQVKLVGSWANQQDDDDDDDEDHSPGRVEVATQSETSSIRKVWAKWVEELVKGYQKRVESSSINKQPQRYTGYMALMTKEVDSQSMVGKNLFKAGSEEESREVF